MTFKSKEEINNVTHKIIGCAMQIHKTLGCGFQEAIYQRALAIEMKIAGLSFEREKEMSIFYRDELIGNRRVDFFIEECVMLELKAVETIIDLHKNQAINYLEAYNLADGLLINFGGISLDFKRVYNKKLVTPQNHPIAKP
ncbi:GxxExxY protein [Mucilaginibacter lappiensis]|uniref:GxxExxY protein n=1 Tax=Mucilaginibacter lappiensis TaxID=354630 RepID=A0ABR6PN13_9SPHI|nr:GxxExxY protein [Mucilaginibacter lappiensis]MBB6111167.1 GxxExxY protein [Mucilaginibacter lappiensis]SIR70669.1 GxxExxY protein [Mucilaginibacter lappiensis]